MPFAEAVVKRVKRMIPVRSVLWSLSTVSQVKWVQHHHIHSTISGGGAVDWWYQAVS
jgi:hypothetical protein